MRYPVPADVPAGIVAFKEVAVGEVTLPIETGDVKLPVASESCAVNTLLEINVPVKVYVTRMLAPGHMVVGETGDVRI